MECKKCKSPGSVILRKKDSYCKECFIADTNHKFRSCIGKNRILSSNEKVLLGVSGGKGSSVLLDLVCDGIKLNTHKVLRVDPVCVHITGISSHQKDVELAKAVIKQCNQYGFDVYVVNVTSFYQESETFTLPEKNYVVPMDTENADRFRLKLKNLSATSQNDFLIKIKTNLFIRIAKMLQCSFVFTAETTTTLASNLLNNLALGRGSQIQHDVGFSDSRDEHVKIIRPMKDLSKEQLDNYAEIKEVHLLEVPNEDYGNSLQRVIKTFMIELQENFSATISTVCKTSEKIGLVENEVQAKKCIFCQSDINEVNTKLTAHEATIFSRAVCFSHPQTQELFEAQNVNKLAVFNSSLCYACGRNHVFTKV